MLIGYARCSVSTQNITMQIEALERAGCERIFAEHMSGTLRDRPQLRAALDFARPSDQICVWKLDRLSRGGVRQLLETVEELQQRGIGLRSLTESIDTETPSGRLALQLFAILSQAEVDNVKMRTSAGLAAARARGRVGGRPKKLTPAKLQVARALLRDGALTTREVAEQIGVGVSTLYRHLPGARAAIGG